MAAIITYELTKQYGPRPALKSLNLQVPSGGSYAVVGREGSGKTTLIRLLSGLARPTSGECTVLGCSPVFESEHVHRVSGTVLDSSHLYGTMTVMQNLSFFAGLNGVDENDALDRISLLLHKLDIWESREHLINKLPTGVVRRVSLIRALVHAPKVLLVDEPAGGYDKETEESMEQLLDSLVREEGLTILLCTENLPYAQRLCSGFSLLKDGGLLARGGLDGLQQAAGMRYKAVLRLREGEEAPEAYRFVDGCWEREIDSEEELPQIIARAVSSGRHLFEAKLVKPTLEEICNSILDNGIRRAGDADEQNDPGQESWTEDPAGSESPTDQDDPDNTPADGEGTSSADTP